MYRFGWLTRIKESWATLRGNQRRWLEKWKTAKDTGVQLVSELALPAVFALLATAYEYHAGIANVTANVSTKSVAIGQTQSLFQIAGSYFTKLFYWGAFFAYGQRALKTVRDRRNHSSLIGKQEAALARLEKLTVDLVGLTTGGDGYCYISNIRHDGRLITSLEISVEGDFSLQEVSVGVTSVASSRERRRLLRETGNYHHVLNSDQTFNLGTVKINEIRAVQCNIALQGIVSRYYVKIYAKNGHFTQRLEVDISLSPHMPVRTIIFAHDNAEIAYPEGTVFNQADWE